MVKESNEFKPNYIVIRRRNDVLYYRYGNSRQKFGKTNLTFRKSDHYSNSNIYPTSHITNVDVIR